MTAEAGTTRATSFKWPSIWLAGRMACSAVALRALVRLVALQRLVRLIDPPPTGRVPQPGDVARIVALSQTVTRYTSRRPETRCLARSLVAFRYLALAGHRPELHVGFERTAQGVRGHAWVVLDGAAVTDDERDLAALTPSMAFVHRSGREGSSRAG